MTSKIIRVVTREADGSVRTRDYDSIDEVIENHEQIGIDDCSTELSLRGFPVFRGLVGPIPENKKIARYESPDVFESLTKEWSQLKVKRRRRRKSSEATPAEVPSPMGMPTLPTVPGNMKMGNAEFV